MWNIRFRHRVLIQQSVFAFRVQPWFLGQWVAVVYLFAVHPSLRFWLVLLGFSSVCLMKQLIVLNPTDPRPGEAAGGPEVSVCRGRLRSSAVLPQPGGILQLLVSSLALVPW